MDRFAAGYSILFAVLFESIAISWIYGKNRINKLFYSIFLLTFDLGVRRFSQDIKLMIGFEISWWWKFCWAVMAPFFIMVCVFPY